MGGGGGGGVLAQSWSLIGCSRGLIVTAVIERNVTAMLKWLGVCLVSQTGTRITLMLELKEQSEKKNPLSLLPAVIGPRGFV